MQQRRLVLFRRMLENPQDLDAAFEYATLSAQVGDLEAAISTLERMLIFAPGLPRLQLELGLLYYRLEAFKTAKAYFESAISGPDVPPEVREKVRQFLSGIEKADRKVAFSGQMRAGIRYQTNANRGPDGEIIILNGLPFQLDALSQADPDGNVYVSGKFHVSRKLPRPGTTLEFDLVTYASKQFKRDEFDLVQAEATLGPAFDLGRFGYDNAALGVYGIVSGAFLDKDYYATFVGAGTQLISQFGARTSGSAKLEYRYKEFYDSPSVPTASNRDGHEVRGSAAYQYIVTPMHTLNVSAGTVRSISRANYLSYWDFAAQAGAAFAFMSPFNGEQKWVLGTSAGIVFRTYDSPDPMVNPGQNQEDTEYIAQGSLNIPVKNGVSVLGEADYRYVHSNYPTRRHNNFGTTLSLVKLW
ncbi:tetratricopeptide repeat protein [Hoeflea sp.]|uniref:tetratricopeptide repeat protein n=1 Tax=Hoeflea sp. TaxID=1940281 RepID=UPI003B02480C